MNIWVLVLSVFTTRLLPVEGMGLNLDPDLYRRSLMSDGRRLVHIPMQATELYGNSTELMYYYANMYVGDFENLSVQALIIDTGSGIMSFPCKEYCVHCGKHINEYYPIKSKSS